MSAPVPAPPNRPRTVEAVFWLWLLAAISLVLLGMLMALTRGNLPTLFRGAGSCSRWRDWLSAIWRAAPGQAMRGCDGQASGSSLALVVLLALFTLMTGGVLWLIPMILTMVGAVLIMRPAAQDWFHVEEKR